ncbi:Archaeal GTP cyclohydrolase III (plasmid) [Natrarchaeobaculum sulfurireducens]|uniref:GTP cyclohydrolase III n=1 Tax=Natrarchaeobaculum sulfurireducens TaxID=2044521 RepID=A0A346PJZ2_9EURY|nr:Archaeal GTP cyclohydrolase III [Natrarchaeobaculum sulfurireducens]
MNITVTSTRESIQISLVQLDNYGPWTVTPSPRRETDLQALQARLYAALAEFVSTHDGYAFFDRFDNMIAVTDGMTVADHKRFQEQVRNQYPVTVSIGIGVGETPTNALGAASQALQAEGSAQDAERTERLATAGSVGDTPGLLTIAHFDVVDVTSEFTDRKDAGETSLTIQRATVSLASYLREEYDGVTRFVGGDNIIALCPSLDLEAFEAAREHVQATTGIDLQVGIGEGETPHEAGYRAKLALEECRETGQRIDRVGLRATIDR